GGAAAGAVLAPLPAAACAAAGALAYLDRMQGSEALRHARVERWTESGTLRFDAATARHLELFQPQPGGEPSHTLWHHLNLCVTSAGARRLRAWPEPPLARLEALAARHRAVAARLADGRVRAPLR